MSRIWDLLRKCEAGFVPAGSDSSDSDLESLPSENVHLAASSHIVVETYPRGPAADRFRLIRMRLQERWDPEKLNTILITSALPHDGKSTTAINLACALAERGKRRVLLIGADLHHATLAKQLGIPDSRGLAECIEDGVSPFSVIRRMQPLGWYLLSAGRPRGNPSELMQSALLPDLFRELSQRFDWILIDSPPVRPLADALLLKDRSQASLLVVRAGCTPTGDVEEAVSLLGKKHLFGIILNGVEGLDRVYAKYYGYCTPGQAGAMPAKSGAVQTSK